MIEIPYLKEIQDLEWALEEISERFQNATELMTMRSVVYGGAIRDAIAGIKLVGDLDIAVPAIEKSEIVNRFLEDPRWRANNSKSSPWARITQAGYDRPIRENIPMQDIIEFVTFKDAMAQIMVSNISGKDPFLSAVGMAKQVDFRCCSMVLTSDGRIFETIKGGYEDCRDRVLRINEESTTIHLDTVQSRIDKLTARGWTSLVDVEATIERVKAQRAKAERAKIREHSQLKNKHKGIFKASKTLHDSFDLENTFTTASDLRDDLEINPKGPLSSMKVLTIPKSISKSIPTKTINQIISESCEGSKVIYRNTGINGLVIECSSTASLVVLRETLIKTFMNKTFSRPKPMTTTYDKYGTNSWQEVEWQTK